VRQPLEQLGRAALLDRSTSVDYEVLPHANRIGDRRLDGERDPWVASDVAELLLLAEMRGDDVLAFETDPDDRHLRAPVRVDRDEVGEAVGLENLARALGEDAHPPAYSRGRWPTR
jgi:hypothetical protein